MRWQTASDHVVIGVKLAEEGDDCQRAELVKVSRGAIPNQAGWQAPSVSAMLEEPRCRSSKVCDGTTSRMWSFPLRRDHHFDKISIGQLARGNHEHLDLLFVVIEQLSED